MAHYGGKTPKRHIAWSNSSKVGLLNQGRLSGFNYKSKEYQHHKTAQTTTKNGKKKFQGRKTQLKESQHLCCYCVFLEFFVDKWMLTWLVWYFSSAALQSTVWFQRPPIGKTFVCSILIDCNQTITDLLENLFVNCMLRTSKALSLPLWTPHVEGAPGASIQWMQTDPSSTRGVWSLGVLQGHAFCRLLGWHRHGWSV